METQLVWILPFCLCGGGGCRNQTHNHLLASRRLRRQVVFHATEKEDAYRLLAVQKSTESAIQRSVVCVVIGPGAESLFSASAELISRTALFLFRQPWPVAAAAPAKPVWLVVMVEWACQINVNAYLKRQHCHCRLPVISRYHSIGGVWIFHSQNDPIQIGLSSHHSFAPLSFQVHGQHCTAQSWKTWSHPFLKRCFGLPYDLFCILLSSLTFSSKYSLISLTCPLCCCCLSTRSYDK